MHILLFGRRTKALNCIKRHLVTRWQCQSAVQLQTATLISMCCFCATQSVSWSVLAYRTHVKKVSHGQFKTPYYFWLFIHCRPMPTLCCWLFSYYKQYPQTSPFYRMAHSIQPVIDLFVASLWHYWDRVDEQCSQTSVKVAMTRLDALLGMLYNNNVWA
jgi:hypothetical protein